MAGTHSSILVVDDDVDTCCNLSDILSDQGYHVDLAHDGSSALELVRKKSYDVALLDFKMPGMDGLELYRRIKRLRAGTVAIIVTAYATASMADDAGAAGVWRVIPKPIDLPNLLRLIEQTLGQPLVLVVDDDQDLCSNLWDLLRERGYRACLSHDAQDASERLRGQHFNVVLIDMRLPKGDGRAIFQFVRQANPQARTILITGYRSEMEQLVDQMLAEGADAACYKPFDVAKLLAILRQLTTTGRNSTRTQAQASE